MASPPRYPSLVHEGQWKEASGTAVCDLWDLVRAGATGPEPAAHMRVGELSEWLGGGSKGKAARLAFLRRELNLNEALAGTIRYQLIHRTASAVIEAKRFDAPHAVMLVHSFSPSREWFQDFEAFASLLRAEVAVNRVVSAGQRAGVHLHIGWICGNEKYLVK